MKKPNAPTVVTSLVLLVGLMGVWQEMNDDIFVLPAEHNLQTTLLAQQEKTLTVSEKNLDKIEWRETGPVTKKELQALAVSVLQNWNDEPPPYVTDGASNYRTSDVFGLLANAIRYYNQLGALPPSVELIHLIEPGQDITVEHGVQIKTTELLAGVDLIEIHDKAGMPSILTLENISITGPEALHGLAQLYLLLESGSELPQYLYLVPTKGF